MLANIDSVEAARAVSQLPLTVLLVLVLVGGYLEWWIYGTLHRSRITEMQMQFTARVAELQGQIGNERKRADLWELRFLELNEKMDAMLRVMAKIGITVDGTANRAANKLESVENKLENVREELATLKATKG